MPFPAGGPADIISRVLIEKMGSLLGQPMVIENRAGAGGLTGIASVAKSDPNGYTIAQIPLGVFRLPYTTEIKDEKKD